MANTNTTSSLFSAFTDQQRRQTSTSLSRNIPARVQQAPDLDAKKATATAKEKEVMEKKPIAAEPSPLKEDSTAAPSEVMVNEASTPTSKEGVRSAKKPAAKKDRQKPGRKSMRVGEYKRITIEMPEDLHKALTTLYPATSATMSDYLKQLIIKDLNENHKEYEKILASKSSSSLNFSLGK